MVGEGSYQIDSTTFELKHQEWFAALSGDFNPLHIDPLVSRCSIFGQPVVHGLHLVFWVLNNVAHISDCIRLKKIKARFMAPALVGQEIVLGLHTRGVSNIRAELTHNGQACSVIDFVLSTDQRLAKTNLPNALNWKPIAPDDPGGSLVVGANASLDICLARDHLKKLYPTLCNNWDNLQLAQILATTRIVGMHVPGLFSLFNELTLDWDGALDIKQPVDRMEYTIEKYLPTYRRISLSVLAQGLTGRLETTMRPRPVRQATLEEVGNTVEPKSLEGERALIIGGTRGIGEIAVKACSAAGAQVLFTYHKGLKEAEGIKSSIDQFGFLARFQKFNVLSECDDQLSNLCDFRPTMLFYFATPNIDISTVKQFDMDKFRGFNSYYVAGFHRVVSELAKFGRPLDVLLPSTIYLAEPVSGVMEYAASKAAAETVAQSLCQDFSNLNCYVHRFPRVNTDQTASVLPTESQDTLAEFLKALKVFRPLV